MEIRNNHTIVHKTGNGPGFFACKRSEFSEIRSFQRVLGIWKIENSVSQASSQRLRSSRPEGKL